MFLALLAGCNFFTDAATRLAADLRQADARLGSQVGSRHTLVHAPLESHGCGGPYKVQIDKVGALVMWCRDDAGRTVASPGTSSHAPRIEAPRTFIVEKPAGSVLVIELERQRRGDRAVIVDVR